MDTHGHLKLVIRYKDGRIVRGITDNFWPTRPSFHVQDVGRVEGSESVEIHLTDLKAVYVVKDFAGQPGGGERGDRVSCLENLRANGTPLRVRFRDGESVLGSSMSYDPEAIGFFLFPANPNSNNLRVFVINDAVDRVEHLKVGAGR